ncbi:MAG TPA: 16S rRNA (uracil(1498)-N(3))-methyltransferase [Sedimenticola sp.]|nr:16S rRNA (uracil(1498)-N(3))-methyltransferase [Sedimenticola sp.]
MRLPRVYTALPLRVDSEVRVEGAPARHLLQVLRLRPGAEVLLFNGDGRDYRGRLLTVERRAAEVAVLAAGEVEASPALAIRLGLGISRGERMDFAIQKAVELGVTEIIPLLTARCGVRLSPERLRKRQEHWQGVVVAACEQSGRRRLPSLHPATALAHSLEEPPAPGVGILLDHRASASLARLPPPPGRVWLLTGPEGGWTGAERAQLLSAGFRGAHLGPRVLRTETAPLAAIASIQALWGDFR